MATKTVNTRIQLKSDTEANWLKAGPKEGSTGFVPLKGELIIYSADGAHPFSRLKVGDGTTVVTSLPFIDSGTLNGNETEIVKMNNFASFPSPGSEDKLYVDLSTNKIYHYAPNSGYTELARFTFSATKENIPIITNWDAGTMTTTSIINNTLTVINGTAPSLTTSTLAVVTDINGGSN